MPKFVAMFSPFIFLVVGVLWISDLYDRAFVAALLSLLISCIFTKSFWPLVIVATISVGYFDKFIFAVPVDNFEKLSMDLIELGTAFLIPAMIFVGFVLTACGSIPICAKTETTEA